ncbi:isocitrate dehydrogenase [bacterium]|nr:isocitrate dehydrogenase [bacterium]
MSTITITEFLGDGIGPELSKSIHDFAAILPIKFEFEPVDLTFENRQKMGAKVYEDAEKSFNKTKLAFKYPTVTKGESPNAKLRNLFDFSVIHRPVISIPGINSNFKENVEVHIIRVATGGTYEHGGEMVSPDVAVSLRVVDRKPCLQAAEFAFGLGQKIGKGVTSASKYTIQKVTDGLFEDAVNAIAKKYPEVKHDVELFDALLAKMIIKPQNYHVIVCLNEYGDFLSDMACGLVGSLGIGASANYAFDANNKVTMAMFDPAGGTAPDIAGQNKVNPAAALLAFGMLLNHIDRYDLGHSLRLALRSLIAEKQCTVDLGGKLSCTDFTSVLIKKFGEEFEKYSKEKK